MAAVPTPFRGRLLAVEALLVACGVALIALFGVNASMIGFGWIQERYEKPGDSLMPFWLGCVAGIIPWLAIGVYLIAPGAEAHAPSFVYAIYLSLFAFFNCFANFL